MSVDREGSRAPVRGRSVRASPRRAHHSRGTARGGVLPLQPACRASSTVDVSCATLWLRAASADLTKRNQMTQMRHAHPELPGRGSTCLRTLALLSTLVLGCYASHGVVEEDECTGLEPAECCLSPESCLFMYRHDRCVAGWRACEEDADCPAGSQCRHRQTYPSAYPSRCDTAVLPAESTWGICDSPDSP